jgi:hypothetical protein
VAVAIVVGAPAVADVTGALSALALWVTGSATASFLAHWYA